MTAKTKFLVLALLLVTTGTFNSLYAQKLAYDTTYRPARYNDRIEFFKKDPIGKKDFVFLGNSITQGGNWGKILAIANAKNRGISGDITFGVLDRLEEIIAAKPAKVFILIGTNDVARNIPDSLIVRNHKKMIERIRKGSKKTQIYFYTILPVNNSFPKKNHWDKEEHYNFINEEIKKYTDKNVTVIDLYSHFIDENKKLRADLTKDGLHLIAAGYEVWAEVLNKGGYLK
ncbi:GDSL-type esterase/lipase family protein [Pedobacter sp.]